VIDTHEHAGEFKDWQRRARNRSNRFRFLNAE
jgi:hypothetical protein